MRSIPSPDVSPTLSLKRFQCSSDLGWEAHGTHCCQETRQDLKVREILPANQEVFRPGKCKLKNAAAFAYDVYEGFQRERTKQ